MQGPLIAVFIVEQKDEHRTIPYQRLKPLSDDHTISTIMVDQLLTSCRPRTAMSEM